MLYCSVGNVRALFDKYWLYLTDDIRKGLINALGNPGYVVPHEQLMNILILKLTEMFANCGGNIATYGLPSLTVQTYGLYDNRLINDELDTEPLMLSMHASSLQSQLNSDQKNIFERITNCILNGTAGFFLCVWSWWDWKNISLERCYIETPV